MKNELSDIVKQIKEEGGFELYLHATRRTDLNDTNLKVKLSDEGELTYNSYDFH